MPGSTPMRQSTSHHAGVELAQSPPAILPGLNLIGFGMRLNQLSCLDALVELAGVAAQRLDQAEGREDGVGAALALADMRGPAGNAQAEPHHADGAARDRGRRSAPG